MSLSQLHRALTACSPKPDRLESSGRDSVVAEAMYAIVGAIALQKGGAEAARVAKERILAPIMGLMQ